MTFETLKKLAGKEVSVTTNDKYRMIAFNRKGHGRIEATLSQDGTTITCRCTPNFREAGLEYVFNERTYLMPCRFKDMPYGEFRKLVTFLNNTETSGKHLPKPEPIRVKKPKIEVDEVEELIQGTVAGE